MVSLDAFSWNLILAAGGVAIVHNTILGPDHYLPFIMLARAGKWSRARTIGTTTLCGIGHILSSLILGGVGLGLGAAVHRIQTIEGVRADWAAWGLVAFGTAYGVWGIRAALRQRRGLNPHAHGHHVHIHTHGNQVHDHATEARNRTSFWSFFIIFVLGPCEPLIPLFVLPASRGRFGLAVFTGVFFGVITISLMVAAVLLGTAGLNRIPFGRLERWSHAMAGGVIALAGVAVLALGL